MKLHQAYDIVRVRVGPDVYTLEAVQLALYKLKFQSVKIVSISGRTENRKATSQLKIRYHPPVGNRKHFGNQILWILSIVRSTQPGLYFRLRLPRIHTIHQSFLKMRKLKTGSPDLFPEFWVLQVLVEYQ